MTSETYQPWVHRIAVVTVATALLPIVVGAAVTTLDAGMAFRDWPTSDGHGMLSYPWLQSAGDKFIEHGHRLAGMLIGIVAIGLAASVWMLEKRRWVRWAGSLVLLAVIVQGLLGGQRVLLNQDVLALFHGSFAALVLALMGAVVLFTSRSWRTVSGPADAGALRRLKALSVVMCGLIFGQYVLGGLLRHLGTALYEHVALAALVVLAVLATAWSTRRAAGNWLRRPARLLVSLVGLQLCLGAGAWITKFGLASVGYVAVNHAPPQVIFRTAHAVVGMLLFMTAVNYTLRVYRLAGLVLPPASSKRGASRVSGVLTMEGGSG